jgi:hypothetical protein
LDYEIAADGVNQGSIHDLTSDLTNIVVNDNCGVQSTTITNPASFVAAQLNPGINVITATTIDINGNQQSCTYNINVLPIGACCGVDPTGCIDGIVQEECPDNGNWVANTKCSEVCGNLLLLLCFICSLSLL